MYKYHLGLQNNTFLLYLTQPPHNSPFPWIVPVACRWDKGSQNNLSLVAWRKVPGGRGTPGFFNKPLESWKLYSLLSNKNLGFRGGV